METRADSAEDWFEAMRQGAFERAWRISDAVLRQRAGSSAAHLPPHLRWLWDGAPLDGKRVLVRCFHGLGDTIQFIRFVPHLARSARGIAVEAQAALLPLIATVPGIERLVPLGGPLPPCDAEIEVMELAHALRITLETLPSEIPYLAPPAGARVLSLPRLAKGRRRVGVCWAAGDWRPARSVPPQCLAPLAGLAGIDWISLQHGRAGPGPPLPFAARQAPEAGIAETAALLRRLDLVITVDTMLAHLAGALGIAVWTLLDAGADWRWMRGATTPWYPTMRLFRQERPGAWDAPVQDAARRLADLASPRPRAAATRSPGSDRLQGEPAMAEHKTAEAQVTEDHATIRRWVEGRGGKPAAVKGTHRKHNAGLLRIMFPGAPHAHDENLEEVSWDDWFEKFDEAKLAFLYEEKTAGGEKSLFNKLIGRETAKRK